ncbi:hypothetical protein ACGFNU_24385 [Spirillospora sp. NPDC048911]|uniref:hypothetical protein n=1 Tax=Spirillospora sp. NPDC048911 TaxID=3364527 RepID=UPI00371F763E
MASDTSLIFNLIAKEKVSRVLKNVRDKFATAGTVATKAFAGLSAGIAPASAAAVALAGVAASFAAAGAAGQAFKLAVQPQMTAVTEAADLYAKAQEAAAEGGKKAAEATKAYKNALADMSPATRATALAFVGLKNDYKQWSDSLAPKTMPVVTSGIQLLRSLLPTLTPFVHAAAGAMHSFLGEVRTGVQSAGFKEWTADMSQAAGPALTNLLTTVKNLAIGLGGLVAALLPANTGMGDLTGGMVAGSEAFAKWGAGLKHSEGFAKFGELARQGGQELGTFALAAGQLLIALAPLLGASTAVALTLAKIVSAVPVPVLTTLAAILGVITIGLKLWALYQAIATTATTVATGVQWAWNAAMAANPIGLIIIAVVALVAGLVLLWKKSETFRDIVKGAFNIVWQAIKGVWDWTKKNWPLLLAILAGPIGWATLAIVKNWGKIKNGGVTVWNWIKTLPNKIGGALSQIGSIIMAPFKAGFNGISWLWNNTVGRLSFWVPGMGGAGFSMPKLPYLAKGGHITGAGFAVVGEAGPEMVHLPQGAAVRPLGRVGGGGMVRVVLDTRGADAELLRLLRKMVRIEGRGNVQLAFGTGSV